MPVPDYRTPAGKSITGAAWPDPIHKTLAGDIRAVEDRDPILITSLADQISSDYKDVVGGLEEVIRQSQKAMGERDEWTEGKMKGFPKYSPSAISDPVGVFEGLPYSSGAGGQAFTNQKGPKVIEIKKFDETEPVRNPPSYPSHLKPWDRKDLEAESRLYGRPLGIPRFTQTEEIHRDDPRYNPLDELYDPTAGYSYDPLDVSSTSQSILEHELGHQAFRPEAGQPGYDAGFLGALDTTERRWRRPWEPVQGRQPGSGRGWPYLTQPSELDTRLAQIKRAYSVAHPGKYIKTPQDARDAWDWWRRMQEGFYEGKKMGDWDKELIDQINRHPNYEQIILQRLRELVQNQPGGLEQALIG